jgi:acyl-CoA thioesterase
MTFETVTRVSQMTWNVPEGWRQGRGAFGGLTLATLARVASESPDAAGRPLRTLTAEIPSAVLVGPARVELETLRAGSGLSTLAAKLHQNGEIVAHAVCSFGKTRVTDFDRDDEPAPSAPPFADVTPASLPSPPGPEFTQHVEYRLIRGMPFAGEKDAVTEGWIRIREPGDVPREIALVALIDAWFPSVLPITAEPLHHRSRLIASQQGYFVELRELFTPRGELCAINQQTMAVIK